MIFFTQSIYFSLKALAVVVEGREAMTLKAKNDLNFGARSVGRFIKGIPKLIEIKDSILMKFGRTLTTFQNGVVGPS